MKKLSLFVFALCILLVKSQGQIYMADSCRISFFSPTSMEDIGAYNTTSKPLLNAVTGDIEISILIQDFVFDNRLMKDHFNKHYMESDKFPHAAFKGKVNEKVDYTSDGTTKVTVTGTMDMHGVQKIITIPGTITIKKGAVFLWTKFDVKMADYSINNPSMLGENLTDHVAITFNAALKPFNAK